MDRPAATAGRPVLTPENLLLHVLPRRRPTIAVRYLATLLIMAAFVGLQFMLAATVVNRPFLLFILPVFLISLLFDRGSGFLATLLGALAANYLFPGSSDALVSDAASDAMGAFLFLFIGLCIATLTETLRKALEKVAHSERERALLLKELNHRIQNDLQMVAALLTLSTKFSDPREALVSAAERVHILSEVYRTLTARDDTPQLHVQDLIETLVAAFRARIMGTRPISITTEVERFDVTTRCATALSLILNELVTNALKHAFPGNREGMIAVTLSRIDGGLELSVSDNGVGADGEPHSGFGSTLVRQLSAQHGGGVRLESGDGLRVVVTMRDACLP
jgi:two-component sensor histidine kinase